MSFLAVRQSMVYRYREPVGCRRALDDISSSRELVSELVHHAATCSFVLAAHYLERASLTGHRSSRSVL
jgi:hypothetical protein